MQWIICVFCEVDDAFLYLLAFCISSVIPREYMIDPVTYHHLSHSDSTQSQDLEKAEGSFSLSPLCSRLEPKKPSLCILALCPLWMGS